MAGIEAARSSLLMVLLLTTATNAASSVDCNETSGEHIVGVNSADSGRLVNELISAYGPGYVRPVVNDSTTTRVEYRLLIHELLLLDTRDQTMSISANLRVSWRDEFLQWEPSKFGNRKEVYIPASKIWQPDITLVRNIDQSFEVMKDTAAKIESTGHVTWLTPAFLSGTCAIRIRYFPFDTQRCEMRFTSWSFSMDKVDLYPATGPDANQTSFTENGIWDLVEVIPEREVKSYFNGDYSEVVYTFVLRRRSEYYAVNVITPFVFLSLLCNLVFLLPPAGKDAKMTLGVTALLALVVFLQIVAGVMPPTGETPILATYFLVVIILVCISIVMVIVVYYILCNTHSPPRWFRRVVLGFMAKAVLMYDEEAAGIAKKDDISEGEETKMKNVYENPVAEQSGPGKPQPVRIPKSLLDDITFIRKKMEIQEINDFQASQWEHASRVIDRWLLIISMVIWAVATIVLLAESVE